MWCLQALILRFISVTNIASRREPRLDRFTRQYSGHSIAWLPGLAFAGSMLALACYAAPPYPTNTCAADRVSNLNCTANDIEIANFQVLNAVTTCVAGQTVNLSLRAFLHVNAQDRHDVGLFLAKDGKNPVVPSASGGSANCAVFGLPFSPAPFADLDGNACGDFDRDGLPQGTQTALDLGLVSYTCIPDATGHLTIPSVVTWQQNASTCNAPPAAWVQPGSPSKCEASLTAQIDVLVEGRIVITKQTAPAGQPDVFAFTATGTGVSPTSFNLSDTQSQTVVTAPLGATPQPYTITEAALGGWNPTAEIVCTDVLGNPASFVTINNANRTLTANMSVFNNQLFCTVINQKIGTGTITINKSTVGGNGTFNFTGFNDFSITTVSNAGSKAFPNLAPGTYSVVESLIAGWDVTGVSCTGAATPAVTSVPGHSASITLAAGENVICTFTNTKTGSITINKTAVGGNGSFLYTTTGAGLSAFSIVTAGGAGTHAFNDLLPGSYSVTEAVPSGWNLTGLNCSGTATPVGISGSTATITLATGESAVCTYTDTAQSSITIDKLAQGGDGTFNFSGSGIAPFAITTSGGVGEQIISGLAAGTYTVTEAPSGGWFLGALSCTDPTGDTTWSGATATIQLAAGETVVCTFTNRLPVILPPIPTLADWLYIVLGTLLLGTGAMWLRKRG